MTLREEIAEQIALAIRGGEENGVNFVGEWGHRDGNVRIDAEVDLREVADKLIDWLNEHDIPTKWGTS